MVRNVGFVTIYWVGYLRNDNNRHNQRSELPRQTKAASGRGNRTLNRWVEIIISGCFCTAKRLKRLASETVEGLSLTLEGVDHIHGGNSLTASVLSVGDTITDHILQEDLEHTTGLLINETRDTLHTTTTGKTANSGLVNTLDVITKDLSVTLGAC